MLRFAPVLVTVAMLGCRGDDGPGASTYQEPELELTNPEPAAWSATGTINAQGTAQNLTDIQVNGEAAQQVDSGFNLDIDLVRGINNVEALGVDSRGDDFFVRNGVIAGEFKSPGSPVNDAALIRINESGLDLMLGQVGGLLDKTTINGALAAVNPVVTYAFAPGGAYLGDVDVNLDAIDYSDLYITGDANPGQIDVVVTIDDLWVDATAVGHAVGNEFSVDVDIWADKAEVVGNIQIEVDSDKELKVTFNDAATNLTNFAYDTSLLPGDLEQAAFLEEVEAALEERITGAVVARVPPLLKDLTEDLDISFETNLLDRDIAAAMRFSSASIDADGVQIGTDVDVTVAGNKDYYYQGYLTADGLGDPSIDRTQDLAMSLYDDMLNRVLFEAWRAGMLEQTLSTADGSLSPETLGLLGASEGEIKVRAGLPPVVIDDRGQLEVQVGELEVELLTPGGSLGDRTVLVVGAEIPITPKITQSAFTLDLGFPTADLVVRETSGNASTEALTVVLEQKLPLATLLLILEDISFPLPSLAGVEVKTAIAQRDGGGAFTNMLVDLEASAAP